MSSRAGGGHHEPLVTKRQVLLQEGDGLTVGQPVYKCAHRGEYR
jgi:hypothetical protein